MNWHRRDKANGEHGVLSLHYRSGRLAAIISSHGIGVLYPDDDDGKGQIFRGSVKAVRNEITLAGGAALRDNVKTQ